MKEMLPGVYMWSWFSEEKQMAFNGHYVKGSGGAVIIDPPPFTEEDARQMQALGTPEAIYITNVHHVRRSAQLAERFNIPIYIHEKDAHKVDIKIGGTFNDGDKLKGGLTAVSVPHGKSPGETAFHLPTARLLIVGDAVIGKPAGTLTLLPPEKFPDAALAREGVRRLLDYPCDAVLVGDGEPVLTGGREALADLLRRLD